MYDGDEKPYLLQEPVTADGAIAAGIRTNGHTPAPPVGAPLIGQIHDDDDDDDDDESDKVYRIIVRRKKLLWGDSMIHARFSLMVDAMSEVPQVGDDATPEAKAAARAQQMAAMRELIESFDEFNAYLDRVVKVMCDGVRVPAAKIPQDFIPQVMDAISEARNKATTKN